VGSESSPYIREMSSLLCVDRGRVLMMTCWLGLWKGDILVVNLLVFISILLNLSMITG